MLILHQKYELEGGEFHGLQTSEFMIGIKNEEGYAKCFLLCLETPEEEKETYWQLVCDLPNHFNHTKDFKKIPALSSFSDSYNGLIILFSLFLLASYGPA